MKRKLFKPLKRGNGSVATPRIQTIPTDAVESTSFDKPDNGIQKTINGILNKITVSSASNLINQILELYQHNASNVVTTAVASSIVNSLVYNTGVRYHNSTILPLCLIVKAIQNRAGNLQLIQLLRVIMEPLTLFVRELAVISEHSRPISTVCSNGIRNLVLFLSLLYNLNVVSQLLVSDLALILSGSSLLVDSNTQIISNPGQCDTLLILLQHCGSLLRSENPGVVEKIFSSIQNSSKKNSTSQNTESYGAHVKEALEQDEQSLSRTHHEILLGFLQELRFYRKSKAKRREASLSPEELKQSRQIMRQTVGESSDHVLTLSWQDLWNENPVQTLMTTQFLDVSDQDSKIRTSCATDHLIFSSERSFLEDSKSDSTWSWLRGTNANTQLRRDYWGLFTRTPQLSYDNILCAAVALDPKRKHCEDLAAIMVKYLSSNLSKDQFTETSSTFRVFNHMCSTRRNFRFHMQKYIEAFCKALDPVKDNELPLSLILRMARCAACCSRCSLNNSKRLQQRIPENFGALHSDLWSYCILFFSMGMLYCSSDESSVEWISSVAQRKSVKDFIRQYFRDAEYYSIFYPLFQAVPHAEKILMSRFRGILSPRLESS